MPTQKHSLPVLPDQAKLAAILARAQARKEDPAMSSAKDPPPPSPAQAPVSPAGQDAVRQKVIDALKTVYDPEIPVNIYEMGLIYDIDISSSHVVSIRMTLTAPACPVAESLPLEVEAKLQQIPEVASANVLLVWDPPWDKDRMSEAAKLQLGLM